MEHLNAYNIKMYSSSSSSSATAARLAYKSAYFLPISFVLIALTLLPLQYHAENFSIQMKKMLDSCADSAGLFNKNQTQILDTLFPYGFNGGGMGGGGGGGGGGVGVVGVASSAGGGSSSEFLGGRGSSGFEQLVQELAVIDEIHRRQMSDNNNLTIKYLSQADCLSKNYTNILNLITIASPATTTTTTTIAAPTPAVSSPLLVVSQARSHRPALGHLANSQRMVELADNFKQLKLVVVFYSLQISLFTQF